MLPRFVKTKTVIPEYLHVGERVYETVIVGKKIKKKYYDYSILLPLLDELAVGEEIFVDYDAISAVVRRRMDNFIQFWNKKNSPKKLGRKNTIDGRFLIRKK